MNILANALKSRGFKKGDFIHVLVQNSPETLMAYFAILKIGAVAGPVNGWWKGTGSRISAQRFQGPRA